MRKKKLLGILASAVMTFALVLTSFPVTSFAAASSEEETLEDHYLTEFPENKEIPLTNLEIPYADVDGIFGEDEDEHIQPLILPGDTVLFTPDEIVLEESTNQQYKTKYLSGSGQVSFLPVHDPYDETVPVKEITEDDYVLGASYSTGDVNTVTAVYAPEDLEGNTDVSSMRPPIGFVNNTGMAINFEGTVSGNNLPALRVYDTSSGYAINTLSIFYGQRTHEYQYSEVSHGLNFVTGDDAATWQGADAYLPTEYALRNAQDAYTLYIPCPVAEGKHCNGFYTDNGIVGSFYTGADSLSVMGQRVCVYNYQVPEGDYYHFCQGDFEYRAIYSDGKTLTVNGNGGTVEGQEQWIAEVDEGKSGEASIVYAGTKHAVDPAKDFTVARDGYEVAGWYYMYEPSDDVTARHQFYGFDDARTYVDVGNMYTTNAPAFTVYPVWVDSDGNYSDPNTGLTTPLEEIVISNGDEPGGDEPGGDGPTVRNISFDTTYDADKYEDGFIAFATYKYSVNGVEIPDANLNFTPADDEKLAELDAKGIHFGDPRIAAAGYDENTVAAFVDYNGAWKESSYLTYVVGTWDDGSGKWSADAAVNMPGNKWVWISDNSATGAYAADDFYIMFQDMFHDKDDYQAYVYDELKSSAKDEIAKVLDANQVPLACFTTMLYLKTKDGPVRLTDKKIDLEKTFDIDHENPQPLPYTDYVWYELKDYKKVRTIEPEFNSGGAAAPGVNCEGTYLLAAVPKATTGDLSKATVASISAKTYTGKKITPALTVTYNGKTLKKDTDYTVTYANNLNAGTATATIKGKGDYTGTKKVSFKINPKVLTVSGLSFKTKYYDGSKYMTLTSTKPKVSGVIGTDDVTVKTKGSKYVITGTASAGSKKRKLTVKQFVLSGKAAANYKLSVGCTVTGTIKKVSVKSVTLKSATASYNGQAQKPVISLITGNTGGKILQKNCTIAYTRNGAATTDFTSRGTITVTVTGTGSFKDSASATYTIK